VKGAEAKARAAHKVVEIVIYPDAPPGFNADYRPSGGGWPEANAGLV
jgi:carboxymethylenebutenolidase